MRGRTSEKAPEHDLIITAESKGIPLAYEMAKQEGKNYILARKGLKAYMVDPVKVEVKSITTAKVQTLYLDKFDIDRMKGKRILIVDDVISTGESLHAIEELVRIGGRSDRRENGGACGRRRGGKTRHYFLADVAVVLQIKADNYKQRNI